MPQPFRYRNFSGGINNSVPSDQIEDNEVVDALNVIFDKEANLKTRPGLVKINNNKNLLTRTEEFDHGDWSKITGGGGTPISITPNTDIAPDSTTTADTLTDSESSTFSFLRLSIPCSDNEKYTISIYVKKRTSGNLFPMLEVRFTGGTLIRGSIAVDCLNGSIVDITGRSPDSSSIVEIGDYYRVSITLTNDNSGNNTIQFDLYTVRCNDLSGSFSDSLTGSNIFWGAQLERGKLSGYHKNVATAPTQSANYLFNRVNSIFNYKRSDGTSALICTSGSEIYRLNSSDYLEKITGGLLLPDDTYWQWTIYDDVALAVNRGTTASGKVGILKIEDINQDAKELEWNRNLLLYTEQFNNGAWGRIGSPIITANTEQDPDNNYTVDTIEDDSTNLLVDTEDLTSGNWSTSGSPIRTPNTDIAPDGTETADTIEDDNSSGHEYIVQSVSCSDSEVYVGSIYIKKLTSSPSHFAMVRVRYAGGSTSINAGVTVDAFNGTIQDISGASPDDSSITSVGNYWRVSVEFQNNASGNNSVSLDIGPASFSSMGGGINITAIGSNVFWGAQLELNELTGYDRDTGEGLYQEVECRDSETYNASIYIKKTGPISYYPVLQLKFLRGTSEKKASVIIDTENGTLTDRTSFSPNDKSITDEGTFWRVNIELANNASGNTTCRYEIYPARATSLTGSLDDFANGQNDFWGAQLEKSDSKHVYKKNEASSHVQEPPHGNYIISWKNRIWVVDADNPNTLKGSGLGDFEDWATPGASGSQSFEIGGHEGDPITGLTIYKGRLIITKSRRMYYIETGDPDTDITQYEIKNLSEQIGCISGYSFQEVIDDQIFLSKFGITSLSAVEKFGDFESSVISQRIEQLSDFKVDEINSASVVIPNESQYILAAPLDLGSIHTNAWVLDFTGIQERQLGFTRFDGKVVGASYSSVEFQGQDRLYIGGYTQSDDEGIAYIYRYGDSQVYNDDEELYNVSVRTKSYTLDDSINNKVFQRVYFVIELLTDNVSISFSYLYNNSEFKIKSWSKSFSGDIFVGAEWDLSEWDSGLWAVQDSLERTVRRKVLGSPGRLGRSIQFIIANVNKDEGFILKSYGFDADPASDWKE